VIYIVAWSLAVVITAICGRGLPDLRRLLPEPPAVNECRRSSVSQHDVLTPAFVDLAAAPVKRCPSEG
jgi:hypothetical protein